MIINWNDLNGLWRFGIRMFTLHKHPERRLVKRVVVEGTLSKKRPTRFSPLRFATGCFAKPHRSKNKLGFRRIRRARRRAGKIGEEFQSIGALFVAP